MVVDQMDALAMQNWEHVQVRINSPTTFQLLMGGKSVGIVRILPP